MTHYPLQQLTIYVARHGETTWNIERRIQGHEDIQLSRDGYRHRRGLFYLLKDHPIRRIYTSALQRTILTATPLAAHLNLPLHSTPDLNEIAFGLLEGETLNDLDAWAETTWNWWLEDPLHRRVQGGGECYLDLRQRAEKFISRLPVNESGEILVIGHYRINQMLTSHLLGMTPEQGLSIKQPNNLVYRIRQPATPAATIEHTLTGATAEPTWTPGLLTSPDARG